MHRRLAKLFLVIAMSVVCSVLCFLIISWSVRDESSVSDTVHDSNEIEVEEIDLEHAYINEGLIVTTVDSGETLGLLLEEECGELAEERYRSDQCLEALEGYFAHKAVFTIELLGVVPRSVPFTHQMLFENYKEDRNLIIKALTGTECSSLEKGPIRLDLRDACSADAFARYFHLAEVCLVAQIEKEDLQSGTYYDGQFLSQLEQYKEGHRLNLYYTKLNERRMGLLRSFWLNKKTKCPTDVLRFSPFADSSTSSDSYFDMRRFHAINARLGNERAIHEELKHHLELGDREFVESLRELYAWSVPLSEAVRHSGEDTGRAIINGVRALVKLEEAGYALNIAELVMSICNDPNEDSEDCETAIRKAELALNQTAIRELRMLDKFESVALELNVYQRF